MLAVVLIQLIRFLCFQLVGEDVPESDQMHAEPDARGEGVARGGEGGAQGGAQGIGGVAVASSAGSAADATPEADRGEDRAALPEADRPMVPGGKLACDGHVGPLTRCTSFAFLACLQLCQL